MEIKRFPLLLSKPFGKREPKHGQKWKRRCVFVLHISLSLSPSNRSKDFFFSEGAFPNIFSVFWEDKTREGESGQAASQKHLLPLPYKLEGKIKEILPVSPGGTECGKTEEEAREFSPLHSRRTWGEAAKFLLSSSAHTRNWWFARKEEEIKKQTFPLQGNGGLCQRRFASHFSPHPKNHTGNHFPQPWWSQCKHQKGEIWRTLSEHSSPPPNAQLALRQLSNFLREYGKSSSFSSPFFCFLLPEPLSWI